MPLSNNELFFQAIHYPESVEQDIILALIEKYPYVQSLRFAYERKIFGEGGGVQDLSSALLYASSPNWLYEFVHNKPADTKSLASEAILSAEEVDAATIIMTDESEHDVEHVAVDNLEEEIIDVEVTATDAIPPTHKDLDELDQLIQAGVAQDYFRTKESKKEVNVVEEAQIVEPVGSEAMMDSSIDSQERVTVYDDDTMPYSFLWWLHKTRLEYAETYQPYVKSPIGPMTPSSDDIAKIHERLDSQLLDQQIRENIFHLQSPEAKLSDEVKTTIAFQIPRKTDEVIEKFIREEPMIQPLQAEKLDLENKARKSSEDQYSLVTETLAKIYAEQGLYPKAIDVYKKLVLKYPEKNAYFAAHIIELEKKLN